MSGKTIHLIGRLIVAEETPARAERILADVASAWVQRSAYLLWRKMCNMAVRDGTLDRCPIDRYTRRAKCVRRPIDVYDASEIPGWMEGIRGSKHEAVMLALLGAGLRMEEGCALTVEDVSPWEHDGHAYALVMVDKALVSSSHGRELKDTKNEFSRREAVIGEPFASRLLELADGVGSGPLCPSGRAGADGALTYSAPSTVTTNYREWCRSHDVRYIPPGKLRHTFATLQGEAGSLDSLVSLTMGHSDGTTRGRNYQRSTRRGMALLADNLADLIQQS